MMPGDPADSPRASEWPDIAGLCDTPRDFLREAFADAPYRADAFRRIDEALTVIAGDSPGGDSMSAFGARAASRDERGAVIRLLTILRYSPEKHLALDALCFLRILGDEGRSLEEIGAEAGIGPRKRGTVHKRYRQIQRLLGDIPGRGDKSPEARATYQKLRTGQRRLRAPWTGSHAWRNRPPSSAPTSRL